MSKVVVDTESFTVHPTESVAGKPASEPFPRLMDQQMEQHDEPRLPTPAWRDHPFDTVKPEDAVKQPAGFGDEHPLAESAVPLWSADTRVIQTPNQSLRAVGLALKTNGDLLPAGGKSLPTGEARVEHSGVHLSALPPDTSEQRQSAVASNPVQTGISGSGDDLQISADLKRYGISADESTVLRLNDGPAHHRTVEAADIMHHHLRPFQLTPSTPMTQPASGLILETLSLNHRQDVARDIGERVEYMLNQKRNSASIRLDPPMLGRLDIHIQIVDEITRVTINTQQAQTRDLIDNAGFRLKEYLQENGYQNVAVDVSHQQRQQSSPHAEDVMGVFFEPEPQDFDSVAENQQQHFLNIHGRVDYFV